MRRTILLADDSPTIQRLVASTFTESEYDIVSVSNGEAAIRKFEEIHPGAVLADIYMPGKNGYEVCAYVRQHPSLGGTPVVLLVGAFDAFDEERAKSLGATANITKPFEPQALVALVDSIFPRDAKPSAVSTPEPGTAMTIGDDDDLMGLGSLFLEQAPAYVSPSVQAMDGGSVDRIVEQVMQKLTRQVVESIAWEVVPDVAEKVVREELRKSLEKR